MIAMQIERLKALPQRADETWQGGLVRMPAWITGEGVEPYRPYLPLWVAVRADKVHTGEILRPDERNLNAAVHALLEFAFESQFGGYRPGLVEVDDPALAEHLGGLLAETGIRVDTVERLDAVRRALDSMSTAMSTARSTDGPGGGKPIPSLLGGGVTVEQMRRFADAAAAFYRAAPWQYLTDTELIRIEEPKGATGLRFAVAMGNARSMYGLAFYRTAADYFKFRRAAVADDVGLLPTSGAWQVTFGPVTRIPPGDADLWDDHALAVADEQAYPFAAWFGPRGPLKRPGAAELSYLEAVLRAFAQTSEAEIDSGRWRKEVAAFDGAMQVTLAIPDLLKPPSFQQWIRRGFTPDCRAHERMFADMDRYFHEHPPADLDETNAVMAKLFSGRKIDELVTQPETPLERAQELCYQAFDTHGRRRVQLARQALEVCPDCADAYVILAEQVGTLEAELDYYRKGVAAGERALGRETFEKEEGHFWGIAATRPYMRARFGLAQTLEQLGRTEEAVEHYQELLRLNPNDNQGVRYLLLPRFMELGRDVEAARLLKQSEEESANWAYARALLAFRLSGKSMAARRELREAFRTNPYVPEFLLDEGPLPMPPHYSPGSPEEAIVCAEELRTAFAETEGALDWLVAEQRQRQKEAVTRHKERKKKRQKRKKRKGR